MNDPEPYELELTPELLEYAHGVAIKEAEARCPKYIAYDDVAQEAVLHLMGDPPKFNPSKGAAPTTLIYVAVQRFVMKYIARQARHAQRYGQMEEASPEVYDADAGPQRDAPERVPKENTTKNSTTDDVLEFIDDEGSRELCRIVMECDGNMSAAARRLGLSEGTVRYRLKMLAPKLLAAGFNPYRNEEWK